jgi:hypothetical protein
MVAHAQTVLTDLTWPLRHQAAFTNSACAPWQLHPWVLCAENRLFLLAHLLQCGWVQVCCCQHFP